MLALLASALLSCTHNAQAYNCPNCVRAFAPAYHAAVAAPAYHAPVAVESIFVATADHPAYAAPVGDRERQATRTTEAEAKQKTLDARFAAIEAGLAAITAKLDAPTLQVQSPPSRKYEVPFGEDGSPIKPAPAGPKPPLVPGALPGLSGPGGGTGTSPAPPGPLDAKAYAILKESCADCHTGGSARKKFKIFEDDGLPSPLTARQKLLIDLRVRRGSMPPPPATLGVEEHAVLSAWVGQDATLEAALKEK